MMDTISNHDTARFAARPNAMTPIAMTGEVLPLGPFLVSEDGLLAPRAPGLAPLLHFAWAGRRCDAAMADGLHLGMMLGRLPSTASGAGSRADRAQAFAALPGLRAGLPPGFRLRLLPDHRLRLEALAVLPTPASAVAMLAAMVGFVLTLSPWLETLEAAGVTGA